MLEEQITLSSQDVYNLYWGEPERLPCNWHTIAEIAYKYNMEVEEVEELLNGLSWERRKKPLNARRVVWDFLTEIWGLEYKIDFEYMTYLGTAPVTFLLLKYNIGINLDSMLEINETREIHDGNAIRFTIPTCDNLIIHTALCNFLTKYKVKRKVASEMNTEEDNM